MMRRLLIVFTVVALCGSPAMTKEPVTDGEVSYVTGGTGTDEREKIEAQAAGFNLKLTHAAPNGDFVSNVQVRISDGQGKQVIDTVTEGPLMYAKLPPGSYTVACTFNGKEQKRTVQVSAQRSELMFTWPPA
jgi:hypothetical protein